MSAEVHIVALSARSPVGLRGDTTAAAIRAGISRVQEHPFMVDATGSPLVCGTVPGLDMHTTGPGRLALLATDSLSALLGSLATTVPLDASIPCWMALPSPRPGLPEQALARIEGELNRTSWPALQTSTGNMQVSAVARGHAGFAAAMETALDTIGRGAADLCIVGGTDSYLDADGLDWLERDRRLLREGSRGGFPPGEASVVLALASDHARLRHNLKSLARVYAAKTSTETADEASEAGLQGVALTDAYRRAARSLPAGEVFEDVYIDINGERARATDYAFALLRCGAHFRDGSQYQTTVGQTGELGAAAAPLHTALACQAFARGYARGENALISCASWGGLRGAILLRRPRG